MGVHDTDMYDVIKDVLGIPKDEPIFILRAQDICSSPTLVDYYDRARVVGCSADFSEGVKKSIDEFIAWERSHGDKVKVPD